MSRSEPKPKIIYKNLEQVIQRSSIVRPSSSKKYETQRQNQRKPMNDISNKKQTTSSLQKRKTKFIHKAHTCNDENIPVTNLYGDYFIQIDAIFTDLQDFFFQAKQKVLKQIRNSLKAEQKSKRNYNLPNEKIQQMKKMCQYIKHISNYFVNNQIPSFQTIHTQQAHNQTFSSSKLYTVGNCTENLETEGNKMVQLSMKNSKARVNRRGQAVNFRKKTIYQLILQQREKKSKGNILGGNNSRCF